MGLETGRGINFVERESLSIKFTLVLARNMQLNVVSFFSSIPSLGFRLVIGSQSHG